MNSLSLNLACGLQSEQSIHLASYLTARANRRATYCVDQKSHSCRPLELYNVRGRHGEFTFPHTRRTHARTHVCTHEGVHGVRGGERLTQAARMNA